jgi:hypothetical protein
MVLFATGLVGGCVVRAQPAMVVARPAPVVVARPAPVVVAEAQPTTVVVTQPQPQTVVVTQPAYPQRVCGQCLQGVQEVCNGCDDNCNGVIDENCRP